MQHEALTGRIIGAAMSVHSALGCGFLESVYRNALAIDLRDAGHVVELERRLRVSYHNERVGDFVADLVVDRRVIVELKAVGAIAPAHEAQLVNYLAATGLKVRLVLNFGARSLEFRRRVFGARDRMGQRRQVP